MDLNNVEFSWLNGSPKHWTKCKVKNKFRIVKEKTDSIEGYPILSLTMRGIVERDISTNAGQLPDTYNGYALLQLDDIVFNPMDLISGWVDKSKFIGLISPSYKVIRHLSNDVQIDYYKYFFQRLYKEKVLFPFGEGVHYEYRWGLGTETLLNFPLLSPPHQEQEQIVAFLDDKTAKIDDLVAKTKKKIELLKEKRTALINHCVTKGLNPNAPMKDSGVKWIGEMPSGWEMVKVKYVSDIVGRIGFRGYSTEDIVDEGEGVVTISPSNIKNDKFNLNNNTYLSYDKYYESPEIMIFENDIILVKTGSTIGKTAIIPQDTPKMTINPQLVVLKNVILFPKFLYFQTTCRFIKESFDVEQTGSTTPTISQEKVNEFPIIKPPIAEQQQIVDYLDEQTSKIDTTISKEEKRIELLKEYRQSLISNVVTGKSKVV